MQINSAKSRGWFHILRIITKAMSLKRIRKEPYETPFCLLFKTSFHILLTDAAIRGNMIVCETRIYSESMFNVTNKITSFTYVCFIGWEEDHRNRHVAHQKTSKPVQGNCCLLLKRNTLLIRNYSRTYFGRGNVNDFIE